MEVFFTYEVANLFYFSAKKKVNQNIEGFLSYLARGTLTCERERWGYVWHVTSPVSDT